MPSRNRHIDRASGALSARYPSGTLIALVPLCAGRTSRAYISSIPLQADGPLRAGGAWTTRAGRPS
ncbi:MAG: hypothetical protein AAF514_12970, partial [Verrucomicrobiota bacterium]